MITVYTMAYNEEVFLQYMIDHYRSKFPNCHIVVYDNQSTDRTIEIALRNNCEVQNFIILAKDLNYISKKEYDQIKVPVFKGYKVLNGLIQSIRKLKKEYS